MSPRIGSVCSGYGGLDMAVMEVFGGSMAWHCQYEPPDKHGREDKHQYAARILAHHWPAVPNHGDLTKVDWDQVEPVDIVTAGFPCTDISYAGLGLGIMEGTRSGLWLAIARIIGALRPRLVVLENVRAIVNRRPGLDVVLADLARLGFDAEWVCVPASDVGAPHERYRWFLLAWPSDSDSPRLEGAGARWAAPERRLAAANADDQRGHRSGACSPGRDEPAAHDLAAANAHGDAPSYDCELPARRNALQQRLRDDVAGRCSAPLADPSRGRQRSDERDLPARQPHIEWGPYEPAVRRWEYVLGRPAPRPTDDRGRLAPAFVEWMMGLPAGHITDVPAAPGMTDSGLRNARLKALGNGVVRQQAVYALRLLLARLDSEVAA